MSNNLPKKILLIDSDHSIGNSMKLPLERHQIKVDVAESYDTAVYLFNQNLYPVVLLELAFPEMPGLVLLQKWRNHETLTKRHTGYVLAAGNRNDREPEEARLIHELAGIELIYKPFTAIQLLPYLQRAWQCFLRNQKSSEIEVQAMTMGRHRDQLKDALALIQNNLPALGLRGIDMMRELYEQHDMLENALSLVDRHLTKQPDSIRLMNAKGRILLKQGKLEDALRVMEVADKKAPDNIERINALAMAYLEAKMPEQSVEKMKQLIRYHPEEPDLKFQMFAKLCDHGFDSHAQKLCRDTASPLEVVRHYNNKGVALAKAGRVDEALAEYERSLQFYPKFKENYRIHYNIALAQTGFKKLMHYEKALLSLDECLSLNPRFEKAIKTRDAVQTAIEKLRKRGSQAS